MALTAGDIAIVGMRADNPSSFSFVLLTNTTAAETISFTDKGWREGIPHLHLINMSDNCICHTNLTVDPAMASKGGM